ncbi:hypothetical protein DAETH_32910 (plasmid) [Deinococcus aetherius]|uniref:Uncharacterized protein n=1 Tax=Deinococcus aetherius TaxID=200252 RepID=A0ABM8AHZ5_9DEIO|nr:hypothetical protein DAETH_32910 [Deinococcus aetherius]
MEEREALLNVLKRQFGVKRTHVAWLSRPAGQAVARVGLLHFRHRDGQVPVWSGRAWRDVRNLRELGYVLAEASNLGTPPEGHQS